MQFYPEDPLQKIMRRRTIAKLKKKIQRAEAKGNNLRALALTVVVAYLEQIDRRWTSLIPRV